jgi:hypothetical protein
VALLCAVAYLGTAAHFVLVQHATCAAHGELVHADGAPAQAGTAERFEDTRLAATDLASEAGHGAEAHCAASLPRRELVREVWAPAPAASPVQDVAVGCGRLAPAEPVARLHLAPKASPPAA